MAKYQVSWIKEDTKGNTNGRDWIKYEVTLKDEQGNETTAKTFDNLGNGTTVEGEITENQWGKNFKKAPSPKAVAGAKFKNAQIKETMEIKNQSIKTFQDSKEFSIMTASTLRMAVDVVTAFDSKAQLSSQDIKNEILYWRQWFMENWSVDKTDVNPF